eukprot:gnl/MRDRNA2_/MRDRNA2_67486_c0_seq1.p1 gnl/MRDRNA2_/MRDRNA2_67486_c0~~gnl/MRDRNA2_/MRDRNA2_67486_c0_seq1.p1  ORF type:complete len:443 (+),score=46.86 gnl/MRDRNA2_/MRDRNA2_67486_c0_seq1:92-1420(+)
MPALTHLLTQDFSAEYNKRCCWRAASWSLCAKSVQWRRFNYVYTANKSLLSEFTEQVLFCDHICSDFFSLKPNFDGGYSYSMLRPYMVPSKTVDVCTEGGDQEAKQVLTDKLSESAVGMVLKPPMEGLCAGVSMVVPMTCRIASPLMVDELVQAINCFGGESSMRIYCFLPLHVTVTDGVNRIEVDSSRVVTNTDASEIAAVAVCHQQTSREAEKNNEKVETCPDIKKVCDREKNKIVFAQRMFYHRCECQQSHSDSIGRLCEGLIVPELKILWVYDRPVVATLKLTDRNFIVWRSDLYEDGPQEALSSRSYHPEVWALLGIRDENELAKKQFEQIVHSLCVNVAPKLFHAYNHSQTMNRALKEWNVIVGQGDHIRDSMLRRMWHGRTDFLLSGCPGNIIPKLGEIQGSSGVVPRPMRRLWVSAQMASLGKSSQETIDRYLS